MSYDGIIGIREARIVRKKSELKMRRYYKMTYRRPTFDKKLVQSCCCDSRSYCMQQANAGVRLAKKNSLLRDFYFNAITG